MSGPGKARSVASAGAVARDWMVARMAPEPGVDDDPLIGCVVDGRFSVDAYLGSGGASRVYRATDRVLGGSCVLKLASTRGSVAEHGLLAEARLTHRLRRRGVPRVIDWGEWQRSPYMVLEDCGSELHKLLVTCPLGPRQAACVARQVADTLVVVHRRGVVHRDVRPWNIMLRQNADGLRATLIDFGCASERQGDERYLAASRPGRSSTRTLGAWYGDGPTHGKSATFDPRHDVFCLGVVLHLMLSPVPRPFRVWHSTQWLHEEPDESALSLVARLGPQRGMDRLETIIRRCITGPRPNRIQTASELSAALAPVAEGRG